MSGRVPWCDARDEDDLIPLRDLWLSRLMFNLFVGWPPETRSFEEFCEAANSHPHADHVPSDRGD